MFWTVFLKRQMAINGVNWIYEVRYLMKIHYALHTIFNSFVFWLYSIFSRLILPLYFLWSPSFFFNSTDHSRHFACSVFSLLFPSSFAQVFLMVNLVIIFRVYVFKTINVSCNVIIIILKLISSRRWILILSLVFVDGDVLFPKHLGDCEFAHPSRY